jgi:hypothetical protein
VRSSCTAGAEVRRATISTIGSKRNASYARKRIALRPESVASIEGQRIMTERDGLLTRIRAEYQEMPGMTLRLEQVARLCGMDPLTCKEVLDALIDAGFLCRRANGAYARVSELTVRPRPAKAYLESPEERRAS